MYDLGGETGTGRRLKPGDRCKIVTAKIDTSLPFPVQVRPYLPRKVAAHAVPSGSGDNDGPVEKELSAWEKERWLKKEPKR